MKTKKQIEITPSLRLPRGLTTRTAVSLGIATAMILAFAAFLPGVGAADSGKDAKPAIVLVHGAFADGSGWRNVIPLLEKDGYTVTAVQNPLTSLADDVTTTRRAIEAQKGPVVLVGHSYGGAVITVAATQTTNVKA